MIFSSLVFLFIFLPVTLTGYYLLRGKWRNYWLLLCSLVFFAWGGVSYSIVLVVSVLFNYFFGRAVFHYLNSPAGRRWLMAGIIFNVVLLVVFKYAGFLTGNLASLASYFSLPALPVISITLPIGISFYTFHAISYLVDIYRRKCEAQRNILDLSLYITMFSQLVAGPIIRYADVWQQLSQRVHTWAMFSSGIEHFLLGLGKKILLANTFAATADALFNAPLDDLGGASAWLGIVCYGLQIYYDFSGYSDMAIGLGRMFGFRFAENFNFPYIAQSVREFWRRWHISLSSFFRDYVYIPLGGDQRSRGRTYLNLLIVFLLTGFWHGASWTFVMWGLFHGAFIVLERLWLGKVLKGCPAPLSMAYTITVVLFAWVLFRAGHAGHALGYWSAMLMGGNLDHPDYLFSMYLNKELMTALIVGIPGALGWYPWILQRIRSFTTGRSRIESIFGVAGDLSVWLFYLVIMVCCTCYLMAGSYNPFIYYRF